MSYNLPWKARLYEFLFSATVAASCRKNLTINRRISSFLDLRSRPSQTSRDGIKTSDVIIDASRDLWFRLYNPTSTTNNSSSSRPVIIYIHGGGFCLLTADAIACESLCRRLSSELEVIVISINYRLAPEHKFPCSYDDCFDALKFFDENFSSLSPDSADPHQLFLLGDSAGGNLIHHSAVKASGYDFKRLKIIGLVLIMPFFGGEERTESEIRLDGGPMLNLKLTDWFWKAFLPDGSDRDHPAANVFGPNSDDISGVKFPPMLLFIGGLDMMQDWQRRYYQGMKKYGNQVHSVEYPNAIHGFWAISALPEYSLFMTEVKDFMQTQLAQKTSIKLL